MASPSSNSDAVFRLSPRIELFPLLHGSGDVAQEVRDRLTDRRFDCLAVPLPPSFELPLEEAVVDLPRISVIVQQEQGTEQGPRVNYVPVDPCQAVIMGIRVAIGEGIYRAYIDRDTTTFEPLPFVSPDAYALKQLPYAAFAAAILPTLAPPGEGTQQQARVAWMAFQLHQLEMEFERILCLCHFADWPWIRQAYRRRADYQEPDMNVSRPERYLVDPASLYFALGELPFLTELYERRRASVHSDRHLSIDGIKELLLETRTRWQTAHDEEGHSVPTWVTPQLLQLYLQYVRNHALLDRRLTPDLYTLVLAAKQMAGDDFAIRLLDTAKTYSYQNIEHSHLPRLSAGLGQLALPDHQVVQATNRLQGAPVTWRSLSLRPRPARRTSRRWSYLWNPNRQCSWPPEDTKIESFHTHVREQAKAIIGADLAKSEKFTTSMKDGLDIRESLRHWHQRRPSGQPKRLELYVKEIPRARQRRYGDFSVRHPCRPRRVQLAGDLVRRTCAGIHALFLRHPVSGEHGGAWYRAVTVRRGVVHFSASCDSRHLDRRGPGIRQDAGGAIDRCRGRPFQRNASGIGDTGCAEGTLAADRQTIRPAPGADSAQSLFRPDDRSPAPVSCVERTGDPQFCRAIHP